MNNLVSSPEYSDILIEMKQILDDQLKETDDSRIGDNPEIWESYPRLDGKMRKFPKER